MGNPHVRNILSQLRRLSAKQGHQLSWLFHDASLDVPALVGSGGSSSGYTSMPRGIQPDIVVKDLSTLLFQVGYRASQEKEMVEASGKAELLLEEARLSTLARNLFEDVYPLLMRGESGSAVVHPFRLVVLTTDTYEHYEWLKLSESGKRSGRTEPYPPTCVLKLVSLEDGLDVSEESLAASGSDGYFSLVVPETGQPLEFDLLRLLSTRSLRPRLFYLLQQYLTAPGVFSGELARHLYAGLPSKHGSLVLHLTASLPPQLLRVPDAEATTRVEVLTLSDLPEASLPLHGEGDWHLINWSRYCVSLYEQLYEHSRFSVRQLRVLLVTRDCDVVPQALYAFWEALEASGAHPPYGRHMRRPPEKSGGHPGTVVRKSDVAASRSWLEDVYWLDANKVEEHFAARGEAEVLPERGVTPRPTARVLSFRELKWALLHLRGGVFGVDQKAPQRASEMQERQDEAAVSPWLEAPWGEKEWLVRQDDGFSRERVLLGFLVSGSDYTHPGWFKRTNAHHLFWVILRGVRADEVGVLKVGVEGAERRAWSEHAVEWGGLLYARYLAFEAALLGSWQRGQSLEATLDACLRVVGGGPLCSVWCWQTVLLNFCSLLSQHSMPLTPVQLSLTKDPAFTLSCLIRLVGASGIYRGLRHSAPAVLLELHAAANGVLDVLESTVDRFPTTEKDLKKSLRVFHAFPEATTKEVKDAGKFVSLLWTEEREMRSKSQVSLRRGVSHPRDWFRSEKDTKEEKEAALRREAASKEKVAHIKSYLSVCVSAELLGVRVLI